MKPWKAALEAYPVLGLLWLLHWLPLAVQAPLGRMLGRLLYWAGRRRRHIARRNLELCFAQLTHAQREALLRRHFGWVGRSLIERGLLLFASDDRLRRLVRVVGDVKQAERSGAAVMWLLPHFVGLDFTAPALMLHQARAGVDVYQKQSNPIFNRWILRARSRFGRAILVDRHEGIRPVLRAIQAGAGFVNAPDMDFGLKDAAFVPFFGVPACTLLAPARMARSMDMLVQPIVVTMLPGGQGYEVHFCAAPPGFDDPDPVRATEALNRWLEQRIREHPDQYLWVHRRFKTRPAGQPDVYLEA